MIHELYAELFSEPTDGDFRHRKRQCVLAADAVICISESTREDMQALYGIDANRIHVIPPGYNDVFRKLKQADSKLDKVLRQPYLLFVGVRTHYKNFDRLIQAYSLWNRREEVALVVVGEPWSSVEERRLAKLQIRDHVLLRTNVDDEELCEIYNRAAAFVYPSIYEGFGIPLLEAMACGCPIIASRIPATLEVAGECPVYFEPAESEDLIAAFDLALSEGRDSHRVWLGVERTKHYSWDKTAKDTLEVYRMHSETA
jgi:glycosyltransferase involved in cell wall biosynthesis